MVKFNLSEVKLLLESSGLISSSSDFSTDWLGQSDSYLRSLKCKARQPSLGAIAVCASRLQRAGEQMIASERYRELGQRFLSMSNRCHEIVNEGAVELELRK